MNLNRVSLKSFLVSARAALKNAIHQSTPVTFVIGNESADLDSICSAILLAYLRTYAPISHSQSQQSGGNKTSKPTLHIPLSNLLNADLTLRPELNPVLSKANLTPSDLLTLSDLPSHSSSSSSSSTTHRSSILRPENTRWLLVDHNALQADLGAVYSSQVVGCIDHHDEEGRVPRDCGDEPRVVEKSGSCASLVVEYCRNGWDGMSESNSSRSKPEPSEVTTWDAELSHLALAPILIDTGNLKTASKVTPTDTRAVKYLEAKIRMLASPLKGDSGYNGDQYFQEISTAKENIGHLSIKDILRKDYKQWTEGEGKGEGGQGMNLGVSSVVKDINFLLDKAGSEQAFFDELRHFAEERYLSICAIMTTSSLGGKFKRELFVWGIDEQGARAASVFEEKSAKEIELQPWDDGKLDDMQEENSWRRGWVQGRLDYSRKQVGPLLRKAMA